MEKFRKKIDECDLKIINLIKKRLNICKKIGIYKNKNNLPIFDQEREKILIEQLKNNSNDELDKKSIEKIYKIILKISKKLQKNYE